MKFYVPEIGDQIRLLADWDFDLFNEYRNESALEFFKDRRKTTGEWDSHFGAVRQVIPAGEILKIDRIYVRKGKKDFSSITFLWKGMTSGGGMEEVISYGTGKPVGTGMFVKIPRSPVRFWAKLVDVNNIEFEKA